MNKHKLMHEMAVPYDCKIISLNSTINYMSKETIMQSLINATKGSQRDFYFRKHSVIVYSVPIFEINWIY